ncbi:MAG: DUF2007 domain-containing protein [Bacteroidetes bacterium]|nr:DUF2007 domain-containing protein [Bacteroidota bacterium]
MSTFITIATFNYAHETVIPKAKLESEGILCFVKDEFTMYLQPFFASTSGGIKLQVNHEDAEEAIQILKDAGYLIE